MSNFWEVLTPSNTTPFLSPLKASKCNVKRCLILKKENSCKCATSKFYARMNMEITMFQMVFDGRALTLEEMSTVTDTITRMSEE